MRNVWLIFRRDVSNLFKNVMSVVLMVGLVVLPSLFAWYNVLACWDVFNNTGNLTVAVANEDEGFESDLMPISVNVGDKVVSALRANEQINWVFVSGDEAIEGTKSGKYYAAVVMPESFSRDMLTFYEDNPQHARMYYYVNEKKNAIAPRITETGADTVSYQVNETFAQTLSELVLGVSQTLSQYVQENGVDERVAKVSDRMRSLSKRMGQTADLMDLYSSLARESQDLLVGSADTLGAARSQADEVLQSVDGGEQTLGGLLKSVLDATEKLTLSLESNKAAMASLEKTAEELYAGLSSDAASAATNLRKKAKEVDAQVASLETTLAKLKQLRGALGDAEGGSGSSDASSRTLVIDKCIATLTEAIDILQKTSADMRDAADKLEAGDASIRESAESLRESAAQAQADISAVQEDVERNLKPGIEMLRGDAEAISKDLDKVAANLAALNPDLTGSVSSVGSVLGGAADKIDGATGKMRSAATSLAGMADAVDEALVSGDVDTLRSLLQGDASELAAALSAPVQVERVVVFPCDNFGSAMTPLYSALALFIGSLVIMVVVKPRVSRRGQEELVNPKPRHLYFGRFGVVALLSLLQTTLMGLGNLLFLQVMVVHPLLFMLCYWFSGLVFTFIIYTLVVAFENLGKAIAVLLLIIQVTACGGSFPLQILPDFVQKISPFVPATHVVNAMRAAMMGVYNNDFWISMGCLALFIVPFLLLGLFLRKPLERFMRFYISKVEASKLVE